MTSTQTKIPQSLRQEVRVRVGAWFDHEEIGSTQDDALARVSAEADSSDDTAAPAGALVVTAQRQTAGRGRTGPWIDAGGNASFVSVAVRGDGLRASDLEGLPHRVAASISHELNQELGTKHAVFPVAPNDLFLGDKKCGGILIDTRTVGSAISWIVIGIGVNGETAPDGFASIPLEREVTVNACVTGVLRSLTAR